MLAKLPSDKVGEPIPAERLYDAVNVIMSYQVRHASQTDESVV